MRIIKRITTCHYSQLFSKWIPIVPRRLRIMRIIVPMSHRVCPGPQFPCGHVAARLKVNSAILLGSSHPVPVPNSVCCVACMKLCCQRFLSSFCTWRRWIAVLFQIEHCTPLFDHLINAHTRSAQGCLGTLANIDNTKINTWRITQNEHCASALFIWTRNRQMLKTGNVG